MRDVTTDRLELRRFDREVVDDLALVFAHPEVWEFPIGRALTHAETADFVDAQIRHWDEHGFGLWTATARADDALIGYVGLAIPTCLPEILPAVEVGWRFAPGAWGRGYASEGASAALDEAFSTLALDVVCSLPLTDNPRSGRVAARLGMRLTRVVEVPANERRGAVMADHYEITRDEWHA